MENKDKKMSAAIRGARTMGPGRSGAEDSRKLVEQILMASAPMEGSVMPSGASAMDASRQVADMRMMALLKAMQDSKRLPAPVTR